jgi:hypothetical protein
MGLPVRTDVPAAPAAAAAAQPGAGTVRLAGAAALLAVVLALFFLPALVGDGQFLHRDSGRMHHPVKAWIAEELRRGHLPEWNPWSGLGYPVVAGAVDAVQHPFNALFLVLPFGAAFKAWVLLSFLLAGTGALFWARQLGLGPGPALGAGLAFALSGFLVSSTDNLTYLTALAALPWLLGTAHAWLRDGGPGRLAALGAASALAAAAGDPQSWGFAVAALPLYGALLAPAGRRARGVGHGVLAAAAAAVAAAPFILPVLAWMPHSTRGEAFDAFEYDRWNFLPLRAAELFLPHLLRDRWIAIWSDLYELYSRSHVTPVPWVLSEYVGATVLALAALGAVRARGARALLVLAALALWMAMGSYAGFGQLARRLPVVSGFRFWEKMAAFVHLLVPLAAAYGLAALRARSLAARRFAAATAAAAAVLLCAHAAARAFPAGLAAWVLREGQQAHAETLASTLTAGLLHAGAALGLLPLAALLVARGAAPRLALGMALAVVVADVAVANVRAYVLYPPRAASTDGPVAAHLAGAPGRVLTPFPLWAGRETPLGALTGPDAEQTADVAAVLGARSLAPAWNVGVVGNFEPYTGMIPARQMRWRRRTGLFNQLPGAGMWYVRWIVVHGDPRRAGQMGLAPPYRVVAADPDTGLALVDVPHRPRAYVASELASVDRRAAMEFVLDPASVASGRSVVEAPLPGGYAPPRGEARVVRDEPERVVVSATSDGPGLVVLNDVYAAGWRATVDGRAAEILPANYMARGVWIPAGAHEVVFTYRTPLLREGWALFCAAFLGVGLWALVRARRPRPAAAGGAPEVTP